MIYNAKSVYDKIRMYSFFFHYNKPLSKKAGKPQLSLHYRKKCYVLDKIICKVPCETKNNKKQPHCVVTGKGIIKIDNNIAYIEPPFKWKHINEKEKKRIKTVPS